MNHHHLNNDDDESLVLSFGAEEKDNQTITTVASTVLPSSPSREYPVIQHQRHHDDDDNNNYKYNSEQQFVFQSMMQTFEGIAISSSNARHNTATNNHNNNNNNNHSEADDGGDPLTEENVEYDISKAFLRLYQRDPTLRCVDLYDITEENAISILSVIPKPNNSDDSSSIALQELCLTYSRLSPTIIPVLNITKRLRILDLGGNQLGDAGVEALMNAIMTSATTNNPNNDDDQCWNSGSHCCGLKFLNVSDNQIGTDGICAIADATTSQFLHLQSLCICQNPNIGNTTLATEALSILSESLESIFCWDNQYSYACKDILQNIRHSKLYWVRPYHWESELQHARDRALRYVDEWYVHDNGHPPNHHQHSHSRLDRSIDPQHYVSHLLTRTSASFQAAREHLLKNFDPMMLDPMQIHLPRRVQSKINSSPASLPSINNVPSSSPTTVMKQSLLEEGEDIQESTTTTAADVKARLRRRREALTNQKIQSSSSAVASTVLDGIALQSSHQKTAKTGYGHSCRRWNPVSDASKIKTTTATTTTNDIDDDDNNNNHNDNTAIYNNKLLAENRRQNLRRRLMLQSKLATVQRDTQYATAKAKLEIFERHRELAHQYI